MVHVNGFGCLIRTSTLVASTANCRRDHSRYETVELDCGLDCASILALRFRDSEDVQHHSYGDEDGVACEVHAWAYTAFVARYSGLLLVVQDSDIPSAKSEAESRIFCFTQTAQLALFV